MAKKTKKRGRPSKFDEGMAEQAMKLAQEGMTNAEIAEQLGVAESTFYLWLQKQSDFSEVLKKGKEVADDLVEASLFKRATGFSQPETKVFVSKLGVVTKVDMVKHHAPDVTAAIFWLKNRRPDKWKDRKEAKIEVSEIEKLPHEQVIKLGKEAIEYLEANDDE